MYYVPYHLYIYIKCINYMLKCIVSSINICNSNITGNINVVQAYT